jgi:hypothetical protein
MALWGKYDAKPQTNTATATVTVTAANATVIGVNTKFADDFAAGDFLNVGGNDYVITTVSNNDTMTVATAVVGGTLVGAGANGAYVVSEKPKYVTYAEADNVGGDVGDVYGVSEQETAAAQGDIPHAGWVRVTQGSGGRSGRTFYEVLVAGSSITNDGADDTLIQDYTITISSQPADATANTSASETAEFSVTAATVPTGGTLGYAWTYANGDSIQAGANVGTTTAATLTIDSSVETANVAFKVTVSATGADSVVSSNATLTITS